MSKLLATIISFNEEQKIGHFPGLIHCFSAGKKLAECAVEHGMSISLSGIITFKTSENLRNIVKNIPLDNILLETDAPFLAPVPNRGKKNEPSFIDYTAQKLADIKNISKLELVNFTTNNFNKLFFN
mgnify:CR=1 FL=1